MCELFAMSSALPSTVNYSLNEFSRHGGQIYSNTSGWGIACYSERDAFLICEPLPASDSPWVEFVASQNIESRCVIAHVRKASRGEPTCERILASCSCFIAADSRSETRPSGAERIPP